MNQYVLQRFPENFADFFSSGSVVDEELADPLKLKRSFEYYFGYYRVDCIIVSVDFAVALQQVFFFAIHLGDELVFARSEESKERRLLSCENSRHN